MTPLAASAAASTIDAVADFSVFNLHPAIMAAVTKAKYTKPTPIQLQAIPHVSAGKDVLGIAQTGTGKTAAFALPILQKLVQKVRPGVQVLVMVPTRELAEQVGSTFKTLAGNTGIKTVTIYGGMGYEGQFRGLQSGAQIVVACPGRLLDHVERRSIDLSGVTTLILDEADQMFDMGFLPTVRQIIKSVPKERQNLLFSATMPSEIKHLAMDLLRNPVTVQVSPVRAASTLTHSAYATTAAAKGAMLAELLKLFGNGTALVFARTKHRVKKLAEDLAKRGFSSTSLQGNLSQNQRDRAMRGFRDGKFQVMVATDIAARGIDVSLVSHVINFDLPATPEGYLHRVGRTGRAERSGQAVSLITPEDRSMVRAIERTLNLTIPRQEIAGFVPPAGQTLDLSRDDDDRGFRGRGRSSDRSSGQSSGRGSFGRDSGRSSDRGSYGSTRGARSGDRRDDSLRSPSSISSGGTANGTADAGMSAAPRARNDDRPAVSSSSGGLRRDSNFRPERSFDRSSDRGGYAGRAPRDSVSRDTDSRNSSPRSSDSRGPSRWNSDRPSDRSGDRTGARQSSDRPYTARSSSDRPRSDRTSSDSRSSFGGRNSEGRPSYNRGTGSSEGRSGPDNRTGTQSGSRSDSPSDRPGSGRPTASRSYGERSSFGSRSSGPRTSGPRSSGSRSSGSRTSGGGRFGGGRAGAGR